MRSVSEAWARFRSLLQHSARSLCATRTRVPTPLPTSLFRSSDRYATLDFITPPRPAPRSKHSQTSPIVSDKVQHHFLSTMVLADRGAPIGLGSQGGVGNRGRPPRHMDTDSDSSEGDSDRNGKMTIVPFDESLPSWPSANYRNSKCFPCSILDVFLPSPNTSDAHWT